MFRYRLHSPDGDDLGEATYAMMIKPDRPPLAAKLVHCSVTTRAQEQPWAAAGFTARRRSPPRD